MQLGADHNRRCFDNGPCKNGGPSLEQKFLDDVGKKEPSHPIAIIDPSI